MADRKIMLLTKTCLFIAYTESQISLWTKFSDKLAKKVDKNPIPVISKI